MATSVSRRDVVFGKYWLYALTVWRQNPEEFLCNLNIKADTFHLDILRDLCDDEVDDSCKTFLLTFLQENVTLLFTDEDRLEQTVGSLHSVFHQLVGTEKVRLKCQFLITVTTILLGGEFDLSSSTIKGQLTAFVDLLLEIVCNTKKETPLLRGTACKCLQEIEISYPGIIEPHAEAVWNAFQQDTSPAFQSCASLISVILTHLVQEKNHSSTNTIETKKTGSSKQILVPSPILSSEIEVFPVVMNLLDQLKWMSSASVYCVLNNLVEVVKCTSDLLPTIFKTWLPKLTWTSYVPLFHLAFILQQEFGSDLFTSREEQMLMEQLISCANHPLLTVAHRLLFLDWVHVFVENRGQFSPWKNISPGLIDVFFPSPFDGPDVQGKKLWILASSEEYRTDGQFQLLVAHLEGIKKLVLSGDGYRPVNSFFRTLFFFYSKHGSPFLEIEIQKLLLTVMFAVPELSFRVVDFIECLQEQIPHSSLPETLVSAIVHFVYDLPVSSVLLHLHCYLELLRKASTLPAIFCFPKRILKFLMEVIKTLSSEDKMNWLLGNRLLDVCQSIIQHHNLSLLYKEIGELLYLIMMTFNEVDIKNRTKMYYAAVTSLASTKVKQIFQNSSHSQVVTQALSSIVDEGPVFARVMTIQYLDVPVLQLKRISTLETQVQDYKNSFFPKLDSGNLIEDYQSFLRSETFTSQVQVSFQVCLCEDAPFDKICGVILQVNTSHKCKNIPNAEFSILEKPGIKDVEPENFTITIAPELSTALTLYFRSEFTTEEGRTYISSPLPHVISFEDLFLPLLVNDCAGKIKVFDSLWKSIVYRAKQGLKESSCQESLCHMQLSKSALKDLVTKRWHQFWVQANQVKDVEKTVTSYDVGVFLPSHEHILMKLSYQNEGTLVYIVTDNWKIFPWLNEVLKSLEMK
ncbi:AP-5 complex subunit beta-1-like isoform X2 [Tachypleus tridentatus]|uniref:AP-5 complex subunit beta-1-like isoform X2 n=1 Tax=Tachypleus tridentatus TaxID=6853 RepID=UPI003FD5525E